MRWWRRIKRSEVESAGRRYLQAVTTSVVMERADASFKERQRLIQQGSISNQAFPGMVDDARKQLQTMPTLLATYQLFVGSSPWRVWQFRRFQRRLAGE